MNPTTTDLLPKITLLIVEDEALIAENLSLSLEDLGYAVANTCCTFAEAQQALGQLKGIDLVLLDINLGSFDPGQSGLALARQLSERGSPPFIFLTAYSDLDTIRQATRLQPSGYLIKPVSSATLFAAIQTALEYAATHAAAPVPTAPTDPAPPAPNFFFVKVGDKAHKLSWVDVVSIEAGKNYVTLRPVGEQRRGYPIRGSLTYVLEQLVPASLRPLFIRVNRRLALNAHAITSYDDEYVYCGPERYENGRTALVQLQALAL